MRIQHNIPAMNSLSKYTNNNNALAKNLEKLSSGYRINSAADDAAGLAISEKMRSQIKGLEQAYNNANDGISLVQVAEGALTEVNSMLTRLTELATQSANGTYEDGVDRVNIQEETEAILDEIDRISKATNYNGINLLDGSLAGAGASGTAITGATIATFKAATTASAAAVDASGSNINFAKETLQVDGSTVTVDWSTLSKDDQGKLNVNWGNNTSKTAGDDAAKIVQDTINQALKDAGFSNSITVTAKTDPATGGSGTIFTFASNEVSGNSSLVVEKQVANSLAAASDAKGIVTVLGGFTQDKAVKSTHTVSNVNDMKSTFNMNINGTNYNVDMSGATLSTGESVASALQTAIQAAVTAYNAAASPDEQLTETDITVEFTSDGRLKINNGTDASISFNDQVGGIAAKALGISSESSNVVGNGLVLQVGDTNKDYQKVTVSIKDMSSKGLGLTGLNLSNQNSAGDAIATIKSAVNKVSTQRGQLGALQNRLDHTLNNLDATTENITSAESQIRDVNMAKEMTAYTKNNILAQAAQSMLAQANSMPQGVLQLLQ